MRTLLRFAAVLPVARPNRRRSRRARRLTFRRTRCVRFGPTTTDASGNTVKTVPDSARELIKIVVDNAGKLVSPSKG
jgi:hypothetical protein